MQLVLVRRKKSLEANSVGLAHEVGGELVRRFHDALPYELTAAQRRVIGEIDADLAAPRPMHRLLQGDVGSGKTVVALTALLSAVQTGNQGALMAPTEVLAEQHHAGVRALVDGLLVPADNLFGERQLRVELLTNRVTGNARKALLADLAGGGDRHRHRHPRADPGGASTSIGSGSSSSTSSTASASSSAPRSATRPARPSPTCS